uniref:Carboxypeptidase n=1 Tax=Holotrichia oblita TaxID=644536 RepID=M1F0A3_HOLOL|nr:serine carboxypeptidase [Holotrichia oblita]
MLFILLLLGVTVISASASLIPIDYSAKELLQTPLSTGEKFDDPFIGLKFDSGYMNVGKKGGKMFYWLVPTDQENGSVSTNKDHPWAIWLQGGPGCSSDFAFLAENGPLRMEVDGTLRKNEYSWHLLADTVWIDQPLGTGFSQTGTQCNYATTEKDIAVMMQEFLEKFIYLYPELRDRPFYIAGESYAGHYIPAVAYHLNKYPVQGLALTGIAIGNGWVDPIKQYPAYAEYAYKEAHIIGRVGYEVAKKVLAECVHLLQSGAQLISLIQCNAATAAILGKRNPYDVRLDCEVPPLCYNATKLTDFLNSRAVQMRLGVDKKWEDCNTSVHTYLLGDFDTETRTKVSKLIKAGLKVLTYNGVQDFICNWVGTESWISALQWEGVTKFTELPYKSWVVEGRALGEYKQLDNFAFLKVYGAGHMVPMDQPAAAYAMMKSFLYSTTLQRITPSKFSRENPLEL